MLSNGYSDVRCVGAQRPSQPTADIDAIYAADSTTDDGWLYAAAANDDDAAANADDDGRGAAAAAAGPAQRQRVGQQ